MIDSVFIDNAYAAMERGFPKFRKRKKKMAKRSVIKNLWSILFIRPEKNNENFFLLYPKPEIERIFSNIQQLNFNHSSFLKRSLFFLQLGYISSNSKIRVWAAKKGYRYLQQYFVSDNITILNCGPSILSPFLAKLCEDKNDESKFYIIQHGLYQIDYMPYRFEFASKACISIIWSNLLAKHYLSLGMDAKNIMVLPTYLFSQIKKLNTSKKVLIIGESINKINSNFDREYQDKVTNVISYLKANTHYSEFKFKKHPRALPSPELDKALEENQIESISEIKLNDFGLVIGAVSTLMIEALAEGCRVLQLAMDEFEISVGDYSLYTSIAYLEDMKNIKEKIDILNNINNNFIKSEFLRVEDNYEFHYKLLL
ncbi:hypothetical protein [Salegentibacter sp. Hel_I_6]|uniref:hypothetical protein n=1 Tax=Salegentibacter sp. Hel_I_6 TaxID=1250278 RepID=UPI00056958CA|nr:hypothetical protein [Salegentibacter sp. Hel_I_6]